jgi:hypothetical protein
VTSLISIADPFSGEESLVHLPTPQKAPNEVMLNARSVTAVDAYSGVVTRALIDYFAWFHQVNVIFDPPDARRAWQTLAGLLGTPPAHFILADGAPSPGSYPRTVILPAQRVRDRTEATNVVDRLYDDARDRGHQRASVRFLAKSAAELLRNALQHADDSPIGAVCAGLYDRSADELELVVADLGMRVARRDDAPQALAEALERSEENFGALASLSAEAASRGLDVSVTVASGTARLYGRGTTWNSASAQAVAGWTVGLRAHL